MQIYFQTPILGPKTAFLTVDHGRITAASTAHH
jgi:hypothetical protein